MMSLRSASTRGVVAAARSMVRAVYFAVGIKTQAAAAADTDVSRPSTIAIAQWRRNALSKSATPGGATSAGGSAPRSSPIPVAVA
jgi:hypothetical protein